VPWAAHKGYGRRAYNPRFKEKEFYQWQIKSQWNRVNPIASGVTLDFLFHMPIPVGTSKVKKRQMLSGMIQHTKKPDTTNLVKFAEDTLKKICIEDDSQVTKIIATKIYSETPKTVIKIYETSSS
jgi:Holliday junction resolvase RusA-like endonuclease